MTELVYASLENKDYQTAKEVISTLKKYWLAGNTVVHYFPKGMFVDDNPEMKGGRIVCPDFKTLESRLGKHEEKGVVFSDDKRTRFTPYNYKTDSQNAFELSQNTGVIALLGGEEKAEKIARASGHYKINPYFWALSNVNSPQSRVADLGSGNFDVRLVVDAVDSEYYAYRYSFGVLDKDTAGVAPQK